MTSATAVLRARHRENVRYPMLFRKTKAEHSGHMRDAAAALAKYADRSPDIAENALALLDHADELDVSPRAGWFPKRPEGWRP